MANKPTEEGTCKAKRGARTLTSHPRLKFVVSQHPSDKHRFRREIRSHVTSLQHDERRQTMRTKRRVRAMQACGIVGSETARPIQKKKKKQEKQSDREEQGKPRSSVTREDSMDRGELEADDYPQSVASSCMSMTASSTSARAFSVGTMAFRTFALDDSGSDMGIALSNIGIDASSILVRQDPLLTHSMQRQYYSFIVLTQSSDIQDQFSTGTRTSVARQRFMHFIFDDPVVLTTAMLLGLRSHLVPFQQAPSATHRHHLLQIKKFLISSINAALHDSRRRLSDEMLICISLLAAYEVKYESPSESQYHVHMSGLARMILLRGGLHAIGAGKPWVERVLVWQDANSSSMAGCEPYFKTESLPTTLRRPEVNRDVYTVRQP